MQEYPRKIRVCGRVYFEKDPDKLIEFLKEAGISTHLSFNSMALNGAQWASVIQIDNRTSSRSGETLWSCLVAAVGAAIERDWPEINSARRVRHTPRGSKDPETR